MQEICQSEYELFNSIQMLLDDKVSYGNLEESQFRNLLRIAEITDSTEIIKNFLRYQIEQSINNLAREKQLLLVERIIHNIRFSAAPDTNTPTPETLEKQLENMANDPEIQAEIKRINQEFMITEMDGLMDS